jgi:hypothetical protein
MKMSDLVFWLNANPNAVSGLASAVSAIATVVLAMTTIVYAWHTWQLAKENRLLRRAGTDPQVVAYATLNPRVFGAIDFVIANIGKGPAQNVSFEILSGGEDFSSKGVRLPHRGARFTFLPQGDQISTFLGMGHELIGNPSLAPFKVEVRYEEVLGAKHVAQFDVNISQFEGLVRLGKSADEEIAESVKKIANAMEKWPRN